MPEKDYTATDVKLAHVFRDPMRVSSRLGSEPFTPRSKDQAEQDRAEYLGRTIGRAASFMLYPFRLALATVSFVAFNFSAILSALTTIVFWAMVIFFCVVLFKIL